MNKSLELELSVFRNDPIKYIQDHPVGFQYCRNNYNDTDSSFDTVYIYRWWTIIGSNDLSLVQDLSGINIPTPTDVHDYLSWDQIYQNLVINKSRSLTWHYLKNMDYEYIAKNVDDKFVYRDDIKYLYLMPKWFYGNHIINNKSIYCELYWELKQILDSFILGQRKRLANTKRAI